ncbi:hypothetical protein HFD88_008084 [Aspergillus terreus]|nr:hypothetical protein HFD88_008084 [Aspergillus terreus]
MHKGRFFGQTHWVHGAAEYLKMMETVEPLLLDETSKVRHDVQKSKYLSQKVKLRRTPPWPTSPTAEMPPKEVADSLVEIYLRTFESVRRVLHIPSFRRDYEALWASDGPPDMAFVVQLKLVLSLGAAMYDDNFSLLPSAVRWVREAQTWFSEPASKSRLTLQFLQTNILLILARDVVGVSGTLVWISAGSLLRLAIFMGLHRDPSYLPGRKNTFTAEMHRRLWSTILEITLQTSLESGGPPLLSLDDFDTQPPGNFDDDQITTEDAAPKPPEEFTQMSIALALRKLFPLRLAILRFLNSIDAHKSYNETLRLDSELRLSYKSICRALQASRSQSGKHPSQFQTHSLEWLVQQSFLALHVPFFTATMHETAFAFSRKVVIDSCIKAWCAIHPASSIMKSSLQADIAPTELQDMLRLVTCASGTVRYASMMICCLVSAELKTQIQEEQLGPVLLRRDLLSILDDAKDWIWKCIGTSEMNFKGYMLLCMTCAHIDALVRGTPKELIPGVLLKAAEDSAARCLALFQEKAGVDESECGIDFEEMSALSGDNLPDVLMGDWWFSMPYVQPNFDVTDSMNWIYNGMASSTQMQSTRSGEQIW